MSRIGGIGSLSTSQLGALRRIRELGAAIAQSTERLSTFKRINSAKDDPSGIIQASLLRQELNAAEETLAGIGRADSLLSTADKGALQVVEQLQAARGLILEAAGGSLSTAEVAANQIVVDSILRGIDVIAQAEFAGQRLLDGSSSFRTTGVDASKIQDVDVLDKQTANDVTIEIEVTQQAAQATDTYDNTTPLAEDTTVLVEGTRGSATVSLSAGASTQEIADAFNAVTYLTGVTASVDGADVDFTSLDYGSEATIEIEAIEGTFTTDSGGSAQGTDALATINGQNLTGDGLSFTVNTNATVLQIDLDPTATGELNSFVVSGGGLEFVVGTSASSTARVGLPKLTTGSLGGVSGTLASIISGGANSLMGGQAAVALQIVDDAIADATRSAAIIGGFQKYTLESAGGVLGGMVEHLSSALSQVEDADVAFETALLANNQLLQQTALEALSIATLNQQSVLNLLSNLTLRF